MGVRTAEGETPSQVTEGVKATREVLLRQFEEILNDPKKIAEAEQFAKKVGYISPADLVRPFTI